MSQRTLQDNAPMENPWYEKQFEITSHIIRQWPNVPESGCPARVSVVSCMQNLWESTRKRTCATSADLFVLNTEHEDKVSTAHKQRDRREKHTNPNTLQKLIRRWGSRDMPLQGTHRVLSVRWQTVHVSGSQLRTNYVLRTIAAGRYKEPPLTGPW